MKINEMNFNNQKGFSTAEIAISVVIIAVVLDVILMIYANLNINIKNLERKSIANDISTSILENMSMVYFDNIDTILSEYEKDLNGEYVFKGNDDTEIFFTKIPSGYTVYLSLEKTEYDEIMRQANIKIEYKLSDVIQTLEFSKVIVREEIDVCNKPCFDKEYLNQIGIDEKYLFWKCNMSNDEDQKVICPINYDSMNKSYNIIDKTINTNWYDYSNKQFAMVLVLDNIDIINENGTISDLKSIVDDNLYIWIPRFDLSESNDLYFLHESTNYSILNNYTENNGFVYNYVDLNQKIKLQNKTNFTNENNENVNGKWILYKNRLEDKEYVLLNNSKYGPMINKF